MALRPCLGAAGAERLLAGLTLLLLLAPAVRASSPQDWAALERQVTASCLARSGLRQPRPLGERVDVDDQSVLLLGGTYPQPHMRNRRGVELCLFDRRSRRAAVVPADDLLQPRPAQPPQPR